MRIFLVVFFVFSFHGAAFAQGLSIIRDTEIENTLEEWSEPVLKAAGLNPDQVRLVLVDSDQVNAFVAGGANIFIYSGLINKADYPEEVIGVIAHEIGHVTGGHLVASRKAMDRASYQSILATVLGIGAAIATGDGSAAVAISAGGQGLAATQYLGHSRTQESAADQAGLKYMNDAQINPEGIVSFLKKLEGQELLPASQQVEYLRTHPLTRNRIETMTEGAHKSPYRAPLGQSLKQKQFDLMKAKLMGFRQSGQVPRYYDIASNNIHALYAHSIMHYQQKNFVKSLELLDQLIKKEPDNGYFYEMKAQILRDSGDIGRAENYYRQALQKLKSNAPLIQVSLAHILIEQQKNSNEAENLLLSSLQKDRRDSRPYRLLATLKGRNGQEAAAQYYLAEEAAAEGRIKDAIRLVSLALRSETLDNREAIKAKDLQNYLEARSQKP